MRNYEFIFINGDIKKSLKVKATSIDIAYSKAMKQKQEKFGDGFKLEMIKGKRFEADICISDVTDRKKLVIIEAEQAVKKLTSNLNDLSFWKLNMNIDKVVTLLRECYAVNSEHSLFIIDRLTNTMKFYGEKLRGLEVTDPV